MKKTYYNITVSIALTYILAFSTLRGAESLTDNLASDESTYISLDLSKKWSNFGLLASGAAIGIISGLTAHLTDGFFPYLLKFNWVLTYKLRKLLIDAVTDSAKKRGENINEAFLDDTAWISDWITYLALKSSSFQEPQNTLVPTSPTNNTIVIEQPLSNIMIDGKEYQFKNWQYELVNATKKSN